MTSSGDNGNNGRVKPPHLKLVTGETVPGETQGPPPESPQGPEGPSSGLNTSSFRTSMNSFVNIIRKFTREHIPSQIYDNLRQKLASSMEVLPDRSRDGSFKRENNIFRLYQQSPDSPIKLTVLKEIPLPPTEPSPETQKIIEMVYFPDGGLKSLFFAVPGKVSETKIHSSMKMKRREKSYHTQLLDILLKRERLLIESNATFENFESLLRKIRGKTDPNTQSVWYENFFVHEGKVYTLRYQDLGFEQLKKSSYQQHIDIYIEKPKGRERLFTFMGTGEVKYDSKRSAWDFSTDRGVRQLLDIEKKHFLQILTRNLEETLKDPKGYEENLSKELKGYEENLPKELKASADFRALKPPLVELKIENIPTMDLGRGPQGEPILHINDSLDLYRLVRWGDPGQSWINPNDPSEVRSLEIPKPLRIQMAWELARWTRSSAAWFFNKFFSIKTPEGSLRLHIYPKGGGQLEVYRNGSIHNIVRVTENGDVVNLDKLIRQEKKTGVPLPK